MSAQLASRPTARYRLRPGARDETIPDLLRWWTKGEEEIAGPRGMFGGAGVAAELDFLDS